jgi:hypothetical protein
MLIPAHIDDVHLCAAVESRFVELSGSYLRLKGLTLIIPKDLQQDLTLWRRMAVRFKQGDMRVTEGERLAVRRFAQWTVDVNCEIRNQPAQTVAWKE